MTAVPETFPNMPAGTRATELAEPPSDNYFLKIFGQPRAGDGVRVRAVERFEPVAGACR